MACGVASRESFGETVWLCRLILGLAGYLISTKSHVLALILSILLCSVHYILFKWNELFPSYWRLLSPAHNLCKQFWPRSGLTKCQAWSGSKLFNTLMILLKEFFEKGDYLKKIYRHQKKKHANFHIQHVFWLVFTVPLYNIYVNYTTCIFL